MTKHKSKDHKSSSLPTKEELVAFIGNNPGKIGTREVARAFGLKNAARAQLKRMLRELAEGGEVEHRRKRLHKPGTLAGVVEGEIIERDRDGEFIAVPDEWDKELHGEPPKIRISIPRRTKPHEAGGIGDRVLLRIDDISDDDDAIRHAGRIIKVLDRAKQRVLGIYRSLPTGAGRLVPIDKKQAGREIDIPKGADGGAQDGDLVAVEVARGGRFGLMVARVQERLGSLKSEKAVSLIAIHAHSIPDRFRAETMEEAEAAQPATMSGREDWRNMPFITIDPADAKDHDDAVHAHADDDHANKDGHVITVAIADVALYVRPNSALDREALVRGNSVYFPDRVVPMLPERISNDLCSLRPKEDRPALAVRMVIEANGRKRSHTFHRVMIKSAAKLSYQQAQAAIDGRPDDTTGPLLAPVLRPLYDAYDALKRARGERSPLDLDLPERKILLKPDGTVDRVLVPERLDAHKLIEEFMILANVAAAETLERARTPLVYRVHDEPSMEKINALREFLHTLDIPLAKGGTLRPEAFNKILARVKGTDGELLVNEVVLRSQAQAEYASENYGHFGLNLRRYAHFTSPIRRYADLIVHRALIRALKLGSDGLPESVDVAQLAEISALISAAERRAMMAERETNDRLIAHFLADRIGATFEARISGVHRAGLFVKLRDTGADGLIPARMIGDEYFRHDEAAHAMIGNRTGTTYRLGDPVQVKLVEAAPVAGALRFELAGGAKTETKRFGSRRGGGGIRPASDEKRPEKKGRPGKQGRGRHKPKGRR